MPFTLLRGIRLMAQVDTVLAAECITVSGYAAATTDTRIRENEADDDGGGIYCDRTSMRLH